MLQQSRWFRGPPFLSKPENEWPREMTGPQQVLDESETKQEFVAGVTERPGLSDALPDVNRFSSFSRLLRATATALVFIRCLKRRGNSKKVTVEDLEVAEKLWWKKVQGDSFGVEFDSLNKTKHVADSSRLQQFSPWLDQDGIMRVRSRAEAAPGIPPPTANPVILDPKHPFTVLLIQHYHNEASHQGQELVLNELRQNYWILQARSAVRRSWHLCQTCKNARTKPCPPEMARLPESRLAAFVRPFTFTGMDYFGPLLVTVARHHEKRYGVLFTCMTTRAVHLELAGSLTTDSALMAIRRMISRRGQPKKIHSDNGTNLRGADNELRSALAELDQDRIAAEMSAKRIDWVFNPQSAPHMTDWCVR